MMRRSAGFTLVELLAVMSIVGILAAVGVPLMSSFLQAANLRASAFDLVGDLAYARSEAIKRNAPVVIVPIGGDGWSAGWRIRGGIAPDAPVLRERTIAYGGLGISAANAQLTFGANGRLQGAAGVTTLDLCLASDRRGRQVRIELSGMARSVHAGCGA